MMAGLAAAGIGLFSFDNNGIPPSLLEVGLIVVLLGVLEVVCSIGFLDATRWAQSLGNIVAILILLASVAVIGFGVALQFPNLSSASMSGSLSVLGILPSTVSIATLVVLRMPPVKSFLDNAPHSTYRDSRINT